MQTENNSSEYADGEFLINFGSRWARTLNKRKELYSEMQEELARRIEETVIQVISKFVNKKI